MVNGGEDIVLYCFRFQIRFPALGIEHRGIESFRTNECFVSSSIKLVECVRLIVRGRVWKTGKTWPDFVNDLKPNLFPFSLVFRLERFFMATFRSLVTSIFSA